MSGSIGLLATDAMPDWQNSFGTEDFTLLPAYGDANLFFVVPRVVRLAQRAGRSPDFFLEFFSDGSLEESLYATIQMGLTREGDTLEAYRLLTEGRAGAALMPATFTTGTFWHLECDDVYETGPFAWEDVQHASIHGRISPKTGRLIYGALAGGSLVIARTAVECEMAAFLPRIESTVMFNPAKLQESLQSLNPGGRSIPFRRMVTFFEESHPGLLTFEGGDRGSYGRSLGLALAGRVRHFLGRSSPCPRISDGPHIALNPAPAGVTPELTAWDLRTPLMTGVPVFLDFDPFTPIIKYGDRDRVTSVTNVPPLPDDLRTERVLVASNLPPVIRNCDEITLTLCVGKDLSRSGQTQTESVTLYPSSGRTTPVELKFKTSKAKTYRARVTAVSEAGVEMPVPWFDCSGDYLYIGAERLPATYITVRATPELLSQANISVLITQGAPGEELADTLTQREPSASFLLFSGSQEARLIVTARDPERAGSTLTLELPCQSLSLDLPDFHEYGPQYTPVTVQFHDGIQTADFEFAPECGTEDPTVLRFLADRPSGQYNYYSTKLFKHRYRFRRSPEEGRPDTEWSDYRLPGQPLIISVRGNSD